MNIIIIGAGLAGCEAALQLRNAGHEVVMYDSKNVRKSKLYQTNNFWELVCMNTLGGVNADIASGLFRIELECLWCEMLKIAHKCEIKNKDYVAVNKEKFSELVTKQLKKLGVTIIEKEITNIPSGDVVIFATGPNTNKKLMENISKFFNNQKFYTSSALVPALYGNSINFNKDNFKKISDNTFKVEIPADIFEKIIEKLLVAKPTHMHYIDQEIDLSKKTPIEDIAKENIDFLKWKFYDNKNNKYSLYIEKDAVLNGVFNVNNFYTRMGVLMQMEIFRMIPWFENVNFARFGLMHKDTYFNSPCFLNNFFKIKNSDQPIYIIGQLSGCDGYLRAFASAVIATNNIIYGDISLSKETMVGWLANYISNKNIKDFQPISATYGLIEWFTSSKNQEKKSLKLINEYINQLSSN